MLVDIILEFVPVIHEYKHDSGIYIRTTIDGTYVTFQVYPSAEQLLKEIGYGDGDNVGWSLIKPLWERGYIYTGNSGTTKQVENHLKSQDVQNLEHSKRQELEQFFRTQKRNSISVPDDVYSCLQNWHNDKYSKDRAKNLLHNSDDTKNCIESIREFGRSPIQVTGINAEKGNPAYEVTVREDDLRCVDLRKKDDEIDLIITFKGQSGHPQGLFVSDGNLQKWKIYSSDANPEYQYQQDLLARFPAIIELLVDIPDYDLTLDLWDYNSAIDRALSEKAERCLQLDWEWCIYSIGREDGESPPIGGKIDLISSIGYGVISTNRVTKDVVFKVGNNSISENEEVTFQIQRKEGQVRAINVDSRKTEHGGNEGLEGEDSTKYGNLIPRNRAKRRAEEGELEWSEGVIKRFDQNDGFGYVADDHGNSLYFTTHALSHSGLNTGSPVRLVVSEDYNKALYLEPIDSDDNDDSEGCSKKDSGTVNQSLKPGHGELGWVRYLNWFYGSLDVEGVSETILFTPDQLSIAPENVSPEMAFSFEVANEEDSLRATELRRKPDQDRSGESVEGEENYTRLPEISEKTEKWIIRYASDADIVFDSIEVASDFGIAPPEYEASIQSFGRIDNWEVVEFSVSDENNPVYQFSLTDGGVWSVEHWISHERSILDIVVSPENEPHHQARVEDGNIISWQPKHARGEMPYDDRHEFILNNMQKW